MTAEMLARSLGRLPDSMVEEAIHARKARRLHPAPWLRAAACIAVVLSLLFGIGFGRTDDEKFITAPSLLAVKAYAIEGNTLEEYELIEGVDFYHTDTTASYSIATSCVQGLPITLSFEDADLTLDISVSHGHFIDGNKDITANGEFASRENNGTLGQQFSVQNNRTIYWRPYTLGNEAHPAADLERDDPAYVDIVLEQEGHVVGYTVIQIKQLSPGRYSAYLLKSVYFPKILGNYQDVTEEYARQQIEKAK